MIKQEKQAWIFLNCLKLNGFEGCKVPVMKPFIRFFSIVGLAVLFCAMSSPLQAASVVVPTAHSTIQEAVDVVQSDADPGEVIINSDATFNETIFIQESVTIRAGEGFSPTIERTGGWHPPIRIRATQDSDTIVVLKDITLRASGENVNSGISVSNSVTAHSLDVIIDEVAVWGENIQSAVSVASATINGDIFFTLTDSFIQIIGEPAGSPECVRLEPFRYNLTTVLHNNRFRFSDADGISIEGGSNDLIVPTTTTIDANIFEGFSSAGGEGRTGVDVSGTGTNLSDESDTQTIITNNLFLRTSVGVDVNGQQKHTHTVFVNNNTIVDSGSGLAFSAYGDSMVEATVNNNIIVGSDGACAGFGIYRHESSGGMVNLVNDFNLLFDNAAGNYSGVTAGAHSISGDPMFVHPEGSNYRLQAFSPAIDTGTNTPSGGIGSGSDLGGSARVQDGDSDELAIVDIGAYEFNGLALDIRANGSDDPISVSSDTPVFITVSLNPGDLAHQNADWWIAAYTPIGWYSYVLPNHWLPGINLCAQFPLFDVYPPFPLLDGNLCIAGDYIFYFALDNNADGLLDATWLDYVEVHVEE